MEGATITVDLTVLIPLAGLMVALLVLVSGVFYRLGQVGNQVNEVDRRLGQHSEENRNTREELRQEIRETREELRQEIHQAREELRQEIREMREENRRNHQQLLQALAHHTHDPATGFATFSIPPGTENPPG